MDAVTTLSTAGYLFAATNWSEFDSDVLILGELHDNPAHHKVQADATRTIQPKAVVFEMLTPDEAQALADIPRDPVAMVSATEGFHWSNIADYAEILAASPIIVGTALSREDMRASFTDGAAAVFGTGSAEYGLTQALPPEEQIVRELMQFDAHCAAMPQEMMSGMVEAQRLRDATFARAVIAALETHGGPVILITGNGHARMDWGVPAYLQALSLIHI